MPTPSFTPTPVVTSTSLPPTTPITTPTPPVTPKFQDPQGIQLSAEPAIYIPGKPITISLDINLTQSKGDNFVMSVLVPNGVHSTDKALDSSIDSKRLMKMDVKAGAKSDYSFSWTVDETAIKPPFAFDVSITMPDGSTLYNNSVVIGAGKYQADPGAEKHNAIINSDNSIKLSIPGNAIDNSLVFDVREPSLNKFPPTALSGNPVEIIAVDKTTAKNVAKFKKPLSLTMRYDPAIFEGHNEENISLFYYDEKLEDWYPMQTTVDTNIKTLTAQTDHLTVFDYNINDWQFHSLPSLDAFQTSEFTGAGIYSMNLWTPPGPAGFQPSLTLSYNSQIVDEARFGSQASWVGMGWSLDTPEITVDYHETESDASDDTFSLSLNGVGGRLLPISSENYGNGKKIAYKTQNQSFLKIVQNTNSTNEDWYVYGKDGSVYWFSSEHRAKTTSNPDACAHNTWDNNLVWRWSLTRATDKYGNQINYTYETDKKDNCLNDVAVYPLTITYGHYRVYFERQARTDFKDAWKDAASKYFFGKFRLKRVWIQYMPENSSVWSDSTNSLRQYEFSYGGDIFPNTNWGTGHSENGVLTLLSVLEKEGVATNPATLKPTTFTYSDMMHLTRVDNGQGGSVEMAYARWDYFNDTHAGDYTRQDSGSCPRVSGDDPVETAGWTQSGATVKCETGSVQFHNTTTDGSGGTGSHLVPESLLKLGTKYQFSVTVRLTPNALDIHTTDVRLRMVDTSSNHLRQTAQSIFTVNDTQGYRTFDATEEVTPDFNANALAMELQCDMCRMKLDANQGWTLTLFSSYYRVVSRTVTDAVTSQSNTETSSYDNAFPNQWETSETAKTVSEIYSYIKLKREYRGNAFVRAKDSENAATYSWYYQNDYLKGSSYHTLTGKEIADTYNDFENESPTPTLSGWQAGNGGSINRDSVYAGSLYQKEYDIAAYTVDYSGNWAAAPALIRTNASEIVSGRTVISHVKLSQNRPYLVAGNYSLIVSDIQNMKGEFGLISNLNQFFGVIVQWEGPWASGKFVARLCETTNYVACSTGGPVIVDNFKPELYYTLMITMDSTNGSIVRLWRDDNAQDGVAIKTSMSGATWQYRQRALSATLWLDSYAVIELHIEVENKYAATLQYGNQVPGHPLDNSTLNNYYDLEVYWNQPTATISRQYVSGSRLWIGTKTEYAYDTALQNNTQYGNPTHVTVYSGNVSSSASDPNGGWAALRSTRTYFRPVTSTSLYLVTSPSRQVVLDCSLGCDAANNLKSETLFIYDGNPICDADATAGLLTIKRVRAKDPSTTDPRYSQVDYGYDHGNVNSISTYTNYATATTSPTVSSIAPKYTTTSAYDTWFHTYTLSETNAAFQNSTTAYDYKLGVPVRTTDANGVVTGASYDVFGRMLSVCAPGDWDGVTCPSTGSTLSISYTDYSGSSNPFQILLIQKVDDAIFKKEVRYYDGLGKMLQIQRPDSQLDSNGAANINLVTDTIYDKFGRVVKQSKPFSYSGSITYQTQTIPYTKDATTTSYDIWGQISGVSEPDTSHVLYTNGAVHVVEGANHQIYLQMTATNSKNQTTTSFSDAFGRKIQVIPPQDSRRAPTTTYNYDALDRLSQVTQESANITFTYDESGRKLTLTDPDMGPWLYTYDPQGNLLTQTDARNCVTTIAYEGLNRPIHKSFGGMGCTVVTAIDYYYDSYNYSQLSYTPSSSYAIGKRTGMTDSTGKKIWEYDSSGRTVLESKNVNDGTTDFGTYVTRWAYNSADLVTAITYPNLETVSTSYMAQGVVKDIKTQSINLIPALVYDINGRVTTVNLGLGNSTYNISYNYFPWTQSLKGGRLNWIKAGTQSDPTALQYLQFDSDSVGNLTSISDGKAGANRNLTQTQTFSYDASNRLLSASATGGGASYGDYALENYTYADAQTGNLTQKAGNTLTYATTNGTCPSSRPHAVTSMIGTGVNATYCYDANGNMSQRTVNGVTTNFSYDAANHMISTSGSVTENYIFDGDGNRVILKSGSTTTVYIGQYFEITIDPIIPLPTSGSGGSGCQASHCYYIPLVLKTPINEPPTHREWRSYFYFGEKRVAMRVQGGTRAILGDVYYLFGDFLGSTSLTVKADTLATTELKYKPWGEIRYQNGTTLTTFRYTGQRLDINLINPATATTNLYWYNSRTYDPYLNRWIQPDSIIPDIYNPLDLDRYSYVRNNPVNFNDPSGHAQSVSTSAGCGENSDCVNDANQDYLFSLAFRGSGSDDKWSTDDWQYYNENESDLWSNPSHWLKPDAAGWEGFAVHAERLQNHYGEDNEWKFVKDFGSLFAGIRSDKHWQDAAQEVAGGHTMRFLNESIENLQSQYLDKRSSENQSHHYAGLFYLGYFGGETMGILVNFGRDTINPKPLGIDWNQGDLNLGKIGAIHGDQLGHLRIQNANVANWIRSLMQ